MEVGRVDGKQNTGVGPPSTNPLSRLQLCPIEARAHKGRAPCLLNGLMICTKPCLPHTTSMPTEFQFELKRTELNHRMGSMRYFVAILVKTFPKSLGLQRAQEVIIK